MNKIPKKLRISSDDGKGIMTELGTMEWDGDKWFITGPYKEGIKDMIGARGMYFGKKIYTVRDRELYKPILVGYSGIKVEVIE